MTLDLSQSIIYDIESYPNCFTLSMECLYSDTRATWEMSDFRDDRPYLRQWFNHLNRTQTPMIGFNNINYDYPVIHFIFNNPNATARDIYDMSMSIINSTDRFGQAV